MSGKDAGRTAPPRIEKRPNLDQWAPDDLLTLEETAFLFWPDGLLTPTSLRTAVRGGLLDVAEIAGKLLTSKAAIERMSVCRPRVRAVAPTAPEASSKPARKTDAELLLEMTVD